MKKYIYLLIVLLTGGSLLSYLYIYKEHREIKSEKACYNASAKALFDTYSDNEKKANTKYLDKTVLVSGKVSSWDKDSKTLVLDEILVATLTDSIGEPILLYDEVKVKGRLIGFDSLLGELKLDQCVIQK